MLCLRVQHHSGTSLAYARLCEPSYGNGCIRIECVVAMGQTPHTSEALHTGHSSRDMVECIQNTCGLVQESPTHPHMYFRG